MESVIVKLGLVEFCVRCLEGAKTVQGKIKFV
jgi:hypothetical protein